MLEPCEAWDTKSLSRTNITRARSRLLVAPVRASAAAMSRWTSLRPLESSAAAVSSSASSSSVMEAEGELLAAWSSGLGYSVGASETIESMRWWKSSWDPVKASQLTRGDQWFQLQP
ncbi:hypothetical protein V8G54_008868 [Vigna mungo]|uniref:Uncharacterized protein n=1 Tax=Vigna mungo TaxID=3915 RepID=A0AAQ3P5Y2_VIGMU